MPVIGRRLHRFAFVGVACALTASAIVAACSSQDASTPTTDASTDTSSPLTADTSPVDSSTPDSSDPDGDAGSCPGATDAAGLDDATVQEGLALVMQYGCANCHQTTPVAEAGVLLNGGRAFLDASVYSKNLTPDRENGLGCWTDPQIVNAMLNGIDDDGKPLCVMPKFSTKGMDGGSALAVAAFLRTLKADPKVVPESMCPVVPDAGADAN